LFGLAMSPQKPINMQFSSKFEQEIVDAKIINDSAGYVYGIHVNTLLG